MMEKRYQRLKEMHKHIIKLGDERPYSTWITLGIPDCPNEDDFTDIAEDIELYNEICELFIRLVLKYGR